MSNMTPQQPPQPTPATGLSAEQIEQAIHDLETFQHPLYVVATGSGVVTPNFLVGVSRDALQTLLATARAYHALREATAPIVERCRGNPTAVYTWDWDEEQLINTLVQVFDATATEGTQP